MVRHANAKMIVVVIAIEQETLAFLFMHGCQRGRSIEEKDLFLDNSCEEMLTVDRK